MDKIDYKIERLQRYFRDPKHNEEGVLEVGDTGQACKNIKIALRYLGYKTKDTDKYDQELYDAVKSFQSKKHHENVDGFVGPGTRRLIAKELFKKSKIRIFHLMDFPKGELFPQVFVSYAREDEIVVKDIVSFMSGAGVNLWVDFNNLGPGANWKNTIEREIPRSRFFLAIISAASLSKKGFVQKEMKTALDVLDEYPDTDVFIIPLRLETCEVNDHRVSKLNYIDLFPEITPGLNRVLEFLARSD